MGTREGLQGMIENNAKSKGKKVDAKKVDMGIIAFIILSVWGVAYLNVSVMGMIEAMVAPILAMILFILPVYATKKVPAMRKYDSKINLFTLVMGVIAILGFITAEFFL